MKKNSMLIVENDVDARELMTMCMSSYGFNVEAVSSVTGALSLLKTRSFNIMISDIDLDGGSVSDIFSHVKEHDLKLPKIIIIVSGHISPKRNKYPQSTAYFTKPIVIKDIVETIQNNTV